MSLRKREKQEETALGKRLNVCSYSNACKGPRKVRKLSVLGQLVCVQKSGPAIPVNLKHDICYFCRYFSLREWGTVLSQEQFLQILTGSKIPSMINMALLKS